MDSLERGLRTILSDCSVDARSDSAQSNRLLTMEYLHWLEVIRDRQPRTVAKYGRTLDLWIDWLGPQSALTASIDQMEAFCTRPRSGRSEGLLGAAGTRRGDVACLRSFYQWAWEKNYSSDYLAKGLHSPQVHNVDPKPIEDEHWLALWEAPFLTLTDRAALGLTYFCGLRRQEFYDLRVRHVTRTHLVDFPRKGGVLHTLPWGTVLRVYMAKMPHILGEHPTLLHGVLDELLRNRDADERLGRWMSMRESAFNKRVSGWATRLGLPHIHPHQLRHSCATNLIRCGVPMAYVAQLLNHQSTNTTMRYVRAGGRELDEWLNTNG